MTLQTNVELNPAVVLGLNLALSVRCAHPLQIIIVHL